MGGMANNFTIITESLDRSGSNVAVIGSKHRSAKLEQTRTNAHSLKFFGQS